MSDGQGIFDGLQGPPRRPKVKAVKPYGYGACSECTATNVGIIRDGKHLYWRHHSKAMGVRKVLVPCSASGKPLCKSIARDIYGLSGAGPIICLCS